MTDPKNRNGGVQRGQKKEKNLEMKGEGRQAVKGSMLGTIQRGHPAVVLS